MYAFKIMFSLLILLFCFKFIVSNPLMVTAGDTEDIAKTAECVLKLSAKYFVELKALSGSIVIININSYYSTTQGLLLKTLHGGIKYSIMVKDSLHKHANASRFPEKAKNYMLILEEKKELMRNINQLNKLPTWNPLAKTIVYYQVKDKEDGPNSAIQFINELRKHKLFKTIVFIYSEEDDEVTSYTWRPYTESKCGKECDRVYILDKCTNGEVLEIEKQADMFPLDLKGCPLTVYAVVSEPYVMPPVKKLENNNYNDSYEFNRGTEINLIKLITQFTNTSLVIRMSTESENWGKIYTNGTATGAYEVLRKDDADIVVGNIEVTRIIRKWFDPTVSYTQDEMTWCVPKAGPAPTWDNLVIIFQWSTWLATFAALIIMGLMFHYFLYNEHKGQITKWPTNSLLMTFCMLLGWSALFNPKSLTFRIIVFGWMCFSVNMGITYVSFLRSFLMHPRFEKQISNEWDLIQSDIPVGGREIYRSYFEANNASAFYIYRKYIPTTFSDGISWAALHRNFSVVSSKRQAEYMHEQLGKGEQLIFCFPEQHNLYKYGVVLLTRKWFPMLGRLNNIIRSVIENGLIAKWNKEAFIHSVSEDLTGSVVPLGISHLYGAFMFVGFMYLASVLVFVGELVYWWFETRSRSRYSGVLARVMYHK